jgi:hypothetical protein
VKPAVVKPKKEKKDKKPFVDHVLEKALEHLRGEIKKVSQGRVLPEAVAS